MFFVQLFSRIGDLANGVVLDVFESALNGVDVAALRPRLEHAQIMTRDDMKRLGKLGGTSHERYCLPSTDTKYSFTQSLLAFNQPTRMLFQAHFILSHC